MVFIASATEEFLFHACLLCFTLNVVFIFCMLISSAIEEFLFHACLVSFWRSGMLFVFLHVWLVMVVFGCLVCLNNCPILVKLADQKYVLG